MGLIMPIAKKESIRHAALALAFGAAMGLTNTTAHAQAERPAPRLDQLKKTKLSVDTGKQQQIWAAVMKTVGAYDQKDKCWTLETRGRRFCMQPAKFAIGSGTLLKSVKQEFSQGNLATSGSTLDIAITGQGFFALKPSLTSAQTI